MADEDFCTQNPDDETCLAIEDAVDEAVDEAVAEAIDEILDDGAAEEGGIFEKWAMMADARALAMYSPMNGQLAFLVLSGVMTARAFLNAFRYHANPSTAVAGTPDYWLKFKIGTSEMYKLSQNLCDYGLLALWGLAFLTQLSSTAGSSSGINAMVWGYGIGAGGLALSAIVSTLRFLTYDDAWSKKKTSTTSATDRTAAEAVVAALDTEVAADFAYGAIAGLVFAVAGDNWAGAQYDNLSEAEMHAYDDWVDETVAELNKEFADEEEEVDEAVEEEEDDADDDEEEDDGDDDEEEDDGDDEEEDDE